MSKDKVDWSIDDVLTVDFVEAVALRRFTEPGAPCSPDSVDPLSRMGILHCTEIFARDMLTVMKERGWTPPEGKE